MQYDLKDKVALIVGAASDAGRVISRRLGALGAKLALVSDDGEGLAALAAELGQTGPRVLAITASPRHAATAATSLEHIIGHFGQAPDILVNALPSPSGIGLEGLTAEGFAATVAGTFGAAFGFLREVLPAMRRQGRGRVINLSSVGYLGLPGGADIAAAQSGIFGLTRSLALEYAKDRITVNTLVLGDRAAPDQSEEDVARRTAAIPVKRLGVDDDIAHAVGFFASDASKYVTGQTFFVCGGKSAHFSMSV